MSALHIAGHAAKAAAEAVGELRPLAEPKNVLLAFVLGFAFGPIGIGLYFRSPKDFFICAAMLLASVFFFGIGVVVGWLFSACYGAHRAHSSNQKLLPQVG